MENEEKDQKTIFGKVANYKELHTGGRKPAAKSRERRAKEETGWG
jgi:hypothetical protein